MKPNKPRDFMRPLRFAVTLALAIVVAVTLLQIILRYVFNAPLIWSEELAKLMIVWIAFLGAAVVCWAIHCMTLVPSPGSASTSSVATATLSSCSSYKGS